MKDAELFELADQVGCTVGGAAYIAGVTDAWYEEGWNPPEGCFFDPYWRGWHLGVRLLTDVRYTVFLRQVV